MWQRVPRTLLFLRSTREAACANRASRSSLANEGALCLTTEFSLSKTFPASANAR